MSIPTPPEMTFGTITGKYFVTMLDDTDPDRDPEFRAASEYTISITPTVPSYKDLSIPATFLTVAYTGGFAADGTVIDHNGNPGIMVMSSVSPNYSPSGWGYNVQIVGPRTFPPFQITVAPGEVIDLTTASPATTASPVVVLMSESARVAAEAAALDSAYWAGVAEAAAAEAGSGGPTGVSTDSGNLLDIGTDSKLYLGPDLPFASERQGDAVDALAPVLKSQRARRRGINVAGAEFSDINVVWETPASYTYLASRGINLVRLPFLWEPLQPVLSGPLNATNLAGLRAQVDAIHEAGMTVILDVHNYAQYNDIAYGAAGSFTQANFADLWRRLSLEFRDHPAVVGYGLMNEPRDLPTVGADTGNVRWQAAQQAALNAIRANNDTTCVMIGGYTASSIGSWLNAAQGQPTPYIVDPADNFRWEAHHYWDSNGGRYENTYAQELINTAGWGTGDTVVKQAMFYLNQWLTWLEENGQRGYLGEFGWPSVENGLHPGDAAEWDALAEEYLTRLDSAGDTVWWTAWATGSRWSDSYDLQFYSDSPAEVLDTPLSNAATLEAHLVPPAMGLPVSITQEAVQATVNAAVAPVVSGKVDKIATASRVYAVSSTGTQTSYGFDVAATATTIPLRGTGGVLRVGTPVSTSDATTKAYVDAQSTTDRDRANHTGTQAPTTIDNIVEFIQDTVGAMFGGGNVTTTYNDAAGTISINFTEAAPDPEAIRDTIGAAMVGVGNITVAINDAADTITISTTATVNATDADLRARSSHTGTQTASTISDFSAAVHTVQDTRNTALYQDYLTSGWGSRRATTNNQFVIFRSWRKVPSDTTMTRELLIAAPNPPMIDGDGWEAHPDAAAWGTP